METTKYLLIVMLSLVVQTVSAEDNRFLFDIKLFDITNFSNGLQNYETLEPFSNPKMIVLQDVPASMKMSGDDDKELMFELELVPRGEKIFDIKFEILKGGQRATGPILTENFSSDKVWQIITNFDKRKVIVAVEMSKVINNGN